MELSLVSLTHRLVLSLNHRLVFSHHLFLEALKLPRVPLSPRTVFLARVISLWLLV